MVKWVLVTMFAFTSIYSSQAQTNLRNLTFDDFKMGIFQYTNGKYKGGKITRTSKWQIEEYDNLKLKFRIDWIGNFEYHLTCVQVNDEVSNVMLGQIIKVKVLEVKDDVYSVLVQNGRKLEKISIRMLDNNPKNQKHYFSLMNAF